VSEPQILPGVAGAAGPQSAASAQAPWTATAWYFVLAYGFSWAWLIPIALAGGTVRAGHGWPTHFPALLGPLLAAFAVTAWTQGRPGLSQLAARMVRVRVPWRWWLFALSPLIVLAAVLLIDGVSGQPMPAASDFAVFSGLPAGWGVLGVAAAILLINGFGEETGWRGYGLPALQTRYGPLRGIIILAVLWAGWHAPMFAVVSTFRSFTAPILAGWFIGLFCGAVVLAWLYNRSGGSILLVAIWHATYNLISGTDAATGLLAAVSTTLVIVLAVVLVGLELRARRHGHASVLGPALRRR
jgi:membrane protease YdiL (CAAX protease family)